MSRTPPLRIIGIDLLTTKFLDVGKPVICRLYGRASPLAWRWSTMTIANAHERCSW